MRELHELCGKSQAAPPMSANICVILGAERFMATRTANHTLVDQFEAAAKAAVATVEIIERTPVALRDAIFCVAGDTNRILFAPPQDLPAGLFADFARDRA